MKNGITSLSFSVLHGDSGVIHLVSPGFRLMDGKITPPTTGKYYQPNYFASKEVVEKIYAAVELKGWHQIYKLTPLLPFSPATSTMRLTIDRLLEIAPGFAPDKEQPLEMRGA